MRILLLLICGIIFSCSPSKKAHEYFSNHHNEFAQDCADAFPVMATIIKGDSVMLTDTLWGTSTDTLIKLDTIYITKTNTKTINNTVTTHDTLKVVDVALVTSIRHQASDLTGTINKRDETITKRNKDYDDMKGNRNWWRIACLITWLLIGGYGFLKFKKIV